MMWLVLVTAGFFELAFTVCMKLSNGLKNVKYTILTVISSCTCSRAKVKFRNLRNCRKSIIFGIEAKSLYVVSVAMY